MIHVLMGVGFIPFINAARLGVMLPGFDAPVGGVAYRGLLDWSFIFGLDLLVIGAFLLFSSRNPLHYIPLVWLIMAFEIVRGIFGDVYFIARGYSAPIYIGFIILHLVIIVTGVVFTRRVQAEAI